MNNDPILIVQMQRMGDLILSFPLMELLRRLYPKHPLWVVGEERFFKPLGPIAPDATYFAYSKADTLAWRKFQAVINLSHRREAAALAGKLKSDAVFGPALDSRDRLFIHGNWQLYRTSLTHNNRYNLFHWADLNALDLIPPGLLAQQDWPVPRRIAGLAVPERNRIGLFLGASKPEKHPGVEFWSELANTLFQYGYRPVLLGGETEAALGAAVAAKLKAPALNLCGHFSVHAFTRFIREIALLVVPDTGPMHLAGHVGTPVLNLSMGPVNAWETGVAAPGHHLIRAGLSCTGCWQCTRDKLYCHAAMRPQSVSAIIHGLLQGLTESAEWRAQAPELELLRTGRNGCGLYSLGKAGDGGTSQGESRPENATHEEGSDERLALARFWQAWFGHAFGFFNDEKRASAWEKLKTAYPELAEGLRSGAAGFAASLSRLFRTDPSRILVEPDFWLSADPRLRPLSGYAQMYVQNALGQRRAFEQAILLAERLADET